MSVIAYRLFNDPKLALSYNFVIDSRVWAKVMGQAVATRSGCNGARYPS